MGHLYRIEKELRQSRAGPRLRAAVRAHQSRPIQERVRRALIRLKDRAPTAAAEPLWTGHRVRAGPVAHVRAMAGGRAAIEIDNNLVENAIRPTAIGKKNWLFVGEADAGQRGAILYTLIESCRRRGIDPHAYLRDVLARLPVDDQLAGQGHHARGMGRSHWRAVCRSISVVGPLPT